MNERCTRIYDDELHCDTTNVNFNRCKIELSNLLLYLLYFYIPLIFNYVYLILFIDQPFIYLLFSIDHTSGYW